jgi:hypothetical protein
MHLRPIALALVLLLPLVAANHTDCVQDVPLAVPFAGFYVYNDICQPGCLFSVWIFHEGNGLDGLQSDEFDLSTPCYPPEVVEDTIVM